MNDMKEKAMGAVKAFFERKGYEVVDEAWEGPEGIGGIDFVATDGDGALVFVDATARIGADSFPEAHRPRELREALAARWLAANGEGYADVAVRFDEVAMMVVSVSCPFFVLASDPERDFSARHPRCTRGRWYPPAGTCSAGAGRFGCEEVDERHELTTSRMRKKKNRAESLSQVRP